MKNRTGKQVIAMGATCCVTAFSALALEAGTYYTASNMWYENPQKIYSTNYHAGDMIPGGTEVEVLSMRKGKVRFMIPGQSEKFNYIHVRKHSSSTAEDKIGRVFTVENQFADLLGNSEVEVQNAIQAGHIALGMTKAQVIASYGPPPSHVTPDAKIADTWKYWDKRTLTREVTFNEGVVVAID